MAGLKLLTPLDSMKCLSLAWRTAQDLGFALTPLENGVTNFTASKGNVIVSVLGGPFSPHCKFLISVKSYTEANELVLEKNSPWLTSGAIGVNRVHRQAEELMDAIGRAIEKEGGTILERKTF